LPKAATTFQIYIRSPRSSILGYPETFTDKFRTYRTGRRYAFASG